MDTDTETRLAALDTVYRIYDRFMAGLDIACLQGCAACCTRNVSLTTLEGYRLADALRAGGQAALFEKLKPLLDMPRFIPRITTNGIAEMCIRGDDIPEEKIDPAWGACPLLENDECPVYRLRPFGCRAMVSAADCRKTGHADMDSFTLTVNTVFLQTIEGLDAGGCTGNIADVLLFFSDDDGFRAYRKGRIDCRIWGLVKNRPVPALMIPPEDRERVAPILRALQSVSGPSGPVTG